MTEKHLQLNNDAPAEKAGALARPILFSGSMVNAILSGAKTQTRRMRGLETVNENPNDWAVIRRMEKVEPCIDGEPQEFPGADDNSWLALKDERGVADMGFNCLSCPFGKIGDRLWIRYTFYQWGHWEEIPNVKTKAGRSRWRFVGEPDQIVFDEPEVFRKGRHAKDPQTMAWHKRSPFFMPRWASRINLEITGVRVERLNEISEEDAIAEGMNPETITHYRYIPGEAVQEPDYDITPSDEFAHLWDKINGKKHPWDSNPFVWVIEFKKEGREGK